MSNSKLVEVTIYSPNCNVPRNNKIDRITPHCVVGQCTIEALGNLFANPQREASSNYGIGSDGRIGLFVDESNRPWTSSSPDNDNRAITIECASDTYPPYAFNSVVYAQLIKLCADICKRNGKNKLIWIADKNKALAYTPKENEMLLTVHRWFAETICPGDWLMSRMDKLAKEVTNQLATKGKLKKVNGEWCYVVNGKVDTTYNGFGKNKYGKWKCTNGKVDFSYNGLAQGTQGWYMVQSGKLDTTYNGLCTNKNGTWVVKKGKVDFSYNGKYKFSGSNWNVKDGKCLSVK